MIPKTFWEILKIHEMGGEGVFFCLLFQEHTLLEEQKSNGEIR
jgi:hypothetical protein